MKRSRGVRALALSRSAERAPGAHRLPIDRPATPRQLEDPAPDKQLARFFMYYDGRSDSALPLVAKEWDSEEARAVSAVVPM